MSGDSFICHNEGGGHYGIQRMETRGVTAPLTMCRVASYNKNYEAQNVNGAEAEKS
jgi:hypothetical protein